MHSTPQKTPPNEYTKRCFLKSFIYIFFVGGWQAKLDSAVAREQKARELAVHNLKEGFKADLAAVEQQHQHSLAAEVRNTIQTKSSFQFQTGRASQYIGLYTSDMSQTRGFHSPPRYRYNIY